MRASGWGSDHPLRRLRRFPFSRIAGAIREGRPSHRCGAARGCPGAVAARFFPDGREALRAVKLEVARMCLFAAGDFERGFGPVVVRPCLAQQRLGALL